MLDKLGQFYIYKVIYLLNKNVYSFRHKIMITKMGEGQQGLGTIVRRNLPGTKTCSFSKWPEESFEEMDSTLAVQQYIQQTIRKDPQGMLG